VLKSTSVRLSLLFAGLISLAFLLSGVAVWFSASRAAEAEIRQQLALEADAIEAELRTEGLDAAVAAIEARAERPGALEYWLTDAAGAPLAGDLRAADGPEGLRRIEVETGAEGVEGADEFFVLTRTLPTGVRLSVAEELGRVYAVQSAILRTLAAIGGAAVALCLIAGVLVTRRALARIEALTLTVYKVAGGDLTARYSGVTRPNGSDIDDIGAGLDAMLDQIETLVEGLRRVSRDIAHDLRTPLTHLRQRLEQARAETTPEARIAAIESAQAKADEVMRTFDAILRLGEIEAGAAKRRFAPVDLAALVEQLADVYRPDIEEGGRSLEVGDLAPCTVVGDRDLLAQALANLIENAQRHTPVGSHIRLCAGTTGGAAWVEVADDGPGIPTDARDAVVKPFARLDASRSTSGSGLGLSIVAAVARLHGAQLEMKDAEPGESGLSVRLTFGGGG
jgi:signal transduction histidine kinase